MGRLRIHFLSSDNTCSARYNIPKNDRHSESSRKWTLVSLIFPVENCGFKVNYDQIDTPQANMSFSNITTTHSVW